MGIRRMNSQLLWPTNVQLLQGAIFTENDFFRIAKELDRRELQLMAALGTHTAEYKAFVAQGSQNASKGGHFSVQVLWAAIEKARLSMKSLDHETARDLDLVEQVAYICNNKKHWWPVRRVRGRWFLLDSLSKQGGPVLLTDEFLVQYISSLRDHVDCTVYVVQGQFPKLVHEQDQSSQVEGRGCWFTIRGVPTMGETQRVNAAPVQPNSLHQGVALVGSAVRAETVGDIQVALRLYKLGVGFLVSALKSTPRDGSDKGRRDALQAKIVQYLDRAEELKRRVGAKTQEVAAAAEEGMAAEAVSAPPPSSLPEVLKQEAATAAVAGEGQLGATRPAQKAITTQTVDSAENESRPTSGMAVAAPPTIGEHGADGKEQAQRVEWAGERAGEWDQEAADARLCEMFARLQHSDTGMNGGTGGDATDIDAAKRGAEAAEAWLALQS